MQYILCKFRDTDPRTYTYHNDGPTVVIGDVIRVPESRGEGWKPVVVFGLSDAKPDFPTKQILGIHASEPSEKKNDELMLEGDAS